MCLLSGCFLSGCWGGAHRFLWWSSGMLTLRNFVGSPGLVMKRWA